MSATHAAVIAPDGTALAVETVGAGPPLVVVVGAFCDRTSSRMLAGLLADRFTVHAYDRRGRRDSGVGTPGPDPDREVADLGAVVANAGGAPALYGHSSGAILALHAVAGGLPVARVAVYEPPWTTSGAGGHGTMTARVRELLAADRPGDAVEAFLRGGPGVPAETVARMRASTMWAGMEALAPMLPDDLALARGGVPTTTLAGIAAPALVMAGGDSDDWARQTVAAVSAAMPNATARTVPGQTHAVDQRVLAPVLGEFLDR